MDRLPVGFAHDVPERDVDGGDRLHRDTPSSVVDAAAEHAVPEAFHLERIFTSQQRGQAVEAFHAFFLAPLRRVDAGLGDAGAGFHVGVAANARVGGNADDPHVGWA